MSPPVEKRLARRLAVSYAGELRTGGSVARVTISDVSLKGCSIELIEPCASLLEHSGMLHVNGVKDRSVITLPIVVANQRIDADKQRIGLQFRTMSTEQTSGLFNLLDEAIKL